jgi:hypothetical protein
MPGTYARRRKTEHRGRREGTVIAFPYPYPQRFDIYDGRSESPSFDQNTKYCGKVSISLADCHLYSNTVNSLIHGTLTKREEFLGRQWATIQKALNLITP